MCEFLELATNLEPPKWIKMVYDEFPVEVINFMLKNSGGKTSSLNSCVCTVSGLAYDFYGVSPFYRDENSGKA